MLMTTGIPRMELCWPTKVTRKELYLTLTKPKIKRKELIFPTEQRIEVTRTLRKELPALLFQPTVSIPFEPAPESSLGFSHLNDSSSLLKSQFYKHPSYVKLSGDYALMFAVLIQAISDVKLYRYTKHAELKLAYASAKIWFLESKPGLYAFETICSLFDFDANYIRNGMIAKRWI